MAEPCEIEEILGSLERFHFAELFQQLNENGAGVGAVLRCLYRSRNPVSAGELSRSLGVSTARVAVLLKKMEARGLIERRVDPNDARRVAICLSDAGRETAACWRERLYRRLGEAIDRIGMARMKDFIAVAEELRSGLQPPEWSWE